MWNKVDLDGWFVYRTDPYDYPLVMVGGRELDVEDFVGEEG